MKTLTTQAMQCLSEYAKREPKDFAQIDAFDMSNRRDDYLDPDGTGRAITWGGTTELMRGATVRVLIPLDVSRETALQLLADIQATVAKLPPGMLMEKTVEYLP
jgi:hypothetical protein